MQFPDFENCRSTSAVDGGTLSMSNASCERRGSVDTLFFQYSRIPMPSMCSEQYILNSSESIYSLLFISFFKFLRLEAELDSGEIC